MSGTLVAMVYYGLQLLSPQLLLRHRLRRSAASFALSIGSSWTVVGTIGIGFMGIAANMGLNPAIAAGAIISGAYFGDKSSPLSDSANLAAAAAGVDLYAHLAETLLTSAVAIAIALAIFFILGRRAISTPAEKIAGIERVFHISLLLFLPLVVVVVLAAFKFPPFTAIFMGALAGGVLAVIIAPERVIAFAERPRRHAARARAVQGRVARAGERLQSSTGIAAIDLLASRGGMDSMLNTIWLIITALAFGGVVEKVGVLDRLITPIIDRRSPRARWSRRSSPRSSRPTSSPPTSTSPSCCRGGCSRARSRGAAAPVVVCRGRRRHRDTDGALIPWNSCGAYMAATLGVATLSYAPYAIFSIASPLLTIAFASSASACCVSPRRRANPPTVRPARVRDRRAASPTRQGVVPCLDLRT